MHLVCVLASCSWQCQIITNAGCCHAEALGQEATKKIAAEAKGLWHVWACCATAVMQKEMIFLNHSC